MSNMINYKQYKYELPYIKRIYFNIIAIYDNSNIECNFCFRNPVHITTDIYSNEYLTHWSPQYNSNKYLSMCKKCFNGDVIENKYFYIKKIIYKKFNKPIAKIIISYI